MYAPALIGLDILGQPPMDRKALLNESLRRRILNMELAPGAIVDELSLADEFGLSRPPVRELMRQMAAEGYLELEPNRPARVTGMDYNTLRGFFLSAPMIYVATTQLAAGNATPREMEELKDVQRNFRKAIDENDVSSRVYYNDLFHLQIGLMAHNDYLMPSLRRLLIDHARLGMTFYKHPPSPDMVLTLQKAVAQHDEIIEALERRSADDAGEIVREHMNLSRVRMADYAAPQGLNVPLN